MAQQPGGEFASADPTTGAQDAGVQERGIGTEISLNACSNLQHFQRPAPSHLSKNAPSLQGVGDADVARSRCCGLKSTYQHEELATLRQLGEPVAYGRRAQFLRQVTAELEACGQTGEVGVGLVPRVAREVQRRYSLAPRPGTSKHARPTISRQTSGWTLSSEGIPFRHAMGVRRPPSAGA
jgi:hypothetical protein